MKFVKRAPRTLHLEVLEDRTLCAVNVLAGVGAIGDSYTAPRGGNNWTEQLAVQRGINLGASTPVTVDGVSFLNYANVFSGSPRTMLTDGSVATLATRVADGSVSLVYLGGIGVDFAAQYAAIYNGALAGPQLATFMSTELADIHSAIDTLTAAGHVKFVLENAGDFGYTPFVIQNAGNFLGLPAGQQPDPAKKQLFTDAIVAENAQLRSLADQLGIPVVDQFGLGARLADASHPPIVGGYTLDVSPTFTLVTSLHVTDPLHLFIDSQHFGPVGQGLKANVFLDAVHQAYGAGIAPLSDQEILTYAYARAALTPPPLTGTSYYDVSGLVQLPAADSIATIRSQLKTLDLGKIQNVVLGAELSLAQNLLTHGQPRLAALSLRIFEASVRTLNALRQINASTANLLIGEVEAVLKLIA